ncbi:MAG: peroxide stress protein YaaA [Rhodopirellula sp. JB044]|uniref:peroxide stress protein YaaA n=1 Tax=Rhodopirellula sp. JB044 TaxID=3342844 RepID=UPI00370B50F3
MLILLSPAKTLDFETPSKIKNSTQPEWIEESVEIAGLLKQETPASLRDLMHISESLAELNHARFQDWMAPHPKEGSQQAIFAFQGDVYQGLQAEKMTVKQMDFAQEHLRILSGLYGILRPLDRILPYRLEMGTSLPNSRGKDLYAYWREYVTKSVVEQLEKNQSRFLLNLASNEYFRCVDAKSLPTPVIAPAFKEMKNGKYKMITFFAKKARGTMASWVIRNRVKTRAKLIQFAEDDYCYSEELSTEAVPVFTRG